MICPNCRFENFAGDDTCDNCGADLSTIDTPQQALDYQDTVLGEHLDALGLADFQTVAPMLGVAQAIRQMHSTGTDCLLVVDGDQLVGIFTDRDAITKAADKRLQLFHVQDFMTPDPVVLRQRGHAGDRDPQDGRGRVPAHPDRRRRQADRPGRGARPVPAPGCCARVTGDLLRPRARIAILADDLIWSTRLADGVRRSGGQPISVRSLESLADALPVADGCLVDLTARAYDGLAALERVTARRGAIDRRGPA